MIKKIINYIKKSPHRNQLEKYIVHFLPKLDGDVLDVGSKNRRYDFLLTKPSVAIDVVENTANNVLKGDVNDLAFENDSFDAVICFEVLEYIDTPDKALFELSRVLKKNGTLLLSVPFVYREHDDMLRFTKKYLINQLSKDFTFVECLEIGNAYTVILDIVKDKINKIQTRLLRYLLFIVYLPLVLLIELIPKVKSTRYPSGYFIVAKK